MFVMDNAPTSEKNESSPTRRQVLRSGLTGCAACLLTGCGGGSEQPSDSPVGLVPRFDHGPVDAGPLSRFNRDGVFADFGKQGFFIVRRDGRLFAVSSIYTHQLVLLHASNGDLGCPRHGSVFTEEGVVLKAPARRPLPRYAVRSDERQHLVVDTSIELHDRGWNEPNAFVPISAV